MVWLAHHCAGGAPPAVVERLNAEFNKALGAAEVKARLASLGVDSVGGTSAAFTQFVKSNVERWAKIIKTAGIKSE